SRRRARPLSDPDASFRRGSRWIRLCDSGRRQGGDMTETTAVEQRTIRREVQDWLDEFNAALSDRNAEAAASLFATACFWRDLVALTWNLKTVEGQDGGRDLLDNTLESAAPRDFHAIEEPEAADGVIEAWLEFQTASGRGEGHLRLRDGQAWTLLTALYEL